MLIKVISSKMSISKAYFIFNIVVLLLIVTVFCYSLIVISNGIQLNCIHKTQNGLACNTCGIPRGLNSFIRLDFNEANSFNSYSVFFGLYLLSHMIIRIIMSLVILIKVNLFTPRRAFFVELVIGISTLIIINQIKN